MLIKCRECQKEVSSAARVCPNCGAKPKTSYMFLWGLLGLALFFVVFIFVNTRPPEATSASADATAPQEVKCLPSEFALSGLDLHHIDGSLAQLTGTVKNNCDYSAIVHLKWMTFNADGSVSTFGFYPLSATQPIASNNEYAFRTYGNIPPGLGHYSVVVDDVQIAN